ncbi:PAS domain-containing sensor histidine kinase [Pseudoalteromonas sp. S558]|uniref:PAS domain-containing sensor histidine kinase n=1 Tax=Pseudoalteromonas sp. S558 TaxID=2066515 RepID=UPI00110B9B05|nr:PAS domain-containing sensor histidine kinase [Pseudoalteromonas sp. S558]TMO10230.1 PAS domain-containing sensor histidine kinase [Pseudoalteromonas sp. S558]
MNETKVNTGVDPLNTDFTIDNAFLAQLVDCLPMGAMIVNAKAQILFANDQLSEILGYTDSELIGMNIDSLLPSQFKSNHTHLMSQFFAKPRKRLMGAGRELFASQKNGAQIPIEIGLNPIRGKQELVLATLVDISQRLRANNMFQRSIQAVPHGVLIIDKNGIIQSVNKSICSSFGYSEEELLDKKMEMLLPKRYQGHHAGLRYSFHQAPSIRSMGVGRDLTALHKDGKEFPVEIGLSPFENTNSEDMVFVSLLDISDRKRMEVELKENNTSLKEFTYVASHDLRSPLRGISNLVEWIKEDLGTTTDEVQHNLTRIDERILKMETLIDNLLDYAKAGKATLDTQKININKLVNNVEELLEFPVGIKLKKDIQLDSIVSAWTPLETVIRNLVSNAIGHHDREEGIILIRSVAENTLCHLTVSDDGPGIPEAAYERIFSLFQTTTSGERQGAGIGLSISRRLTEAHGGKLNVTSNQPQRGVTFHVWWPRFARKEIND